MSHPEIRLKNGDVILAKDGRRYEVRNITAQVYNKLYVKDVETQQNGYIITGAIVCVEKRFYNKDLYNLRKLRYIQGLGIWGLGLFIFLLAYHIESATLLSVSLPIQLFSIFPFTSLTFDVEKYIRFVKMYGWNERYVHNCFNKGY